MDKRLDGQLGAFFLSAWPMLLSRISKIDEFKGWWKGRFDPPPAYLAALRKKTIALSASASVGIDWIGLPLRRDELPPAVPPARAEEIRRASAASYAQLLRTIFDGHSEIPLSHEAILRFHSDLLRHSPRDQSHRGAYRSSHDRSAFYLRKSVESIALRPTDPGSIEGEMDRLFAWTNSRLGTAGFHPLVVVAGFLLEFLAIRPFSAGNGRTSRLLTNLLLLKCGYAYLPYASLEKVIFERKAEYYLALRKSQASRHMIRPDMGPWMTAFLDAMRAQASELKALMAGSPRENTLSGNQSRVLALFERRGEITNRLAAAELGLPRETAKQVLNRLLALNLVSRIGAGRAVRYRRTEPDLQSR